MNACTKLDFDGSGRPMFSPEQEDSLDQARRTCSEFLRRSNAFGMDALVNNEEVALLVIAALHAGNLERARYAVEAVIESEILATFKLHDDDFDKIEREYRAYERTMPRVVLPEVQS